MEEDDEIHSHQSGSPSPPSGTAGNGRIADDFAGATSPSSQQQPPPPQQQQSSLTLALPIQQLRAPTAAPAGGGGGREDCWSEGSTGVLIGAWGERYLELNRGNLKEKHWKEVAEIVSCAGGGARTRPPRTHVQCKYRIDTVKRKYKQEKAKVAAGHGPSKWAFFETMDRIIGPAQAHNAPRTGPNKARRQQPPALLDVAPTISRPPQQPLRAGPGSDSDTESDKSAEFLRKTTHPQHHPPRLPVVARTDRKRGWEEGEGKGEGVYERAEMGKMRQAVEMEKQRLRFAKEAELERMQLLMAAQVEITKMGRRRRRRRRDVHEKRGGGSGGGCNRN
ncbi:hypothetical protein CDL15_Pgr004902 [Punica granatum]|uniref:Myb/SANT-like DNA-binding domain-containing protein n=1 Tax=Punica granatum TaxID=22663 RepID=A0A218W7X7_PUNGR|nr:hypothetical protein CDL15_Pgr004902 [Punica granatum]